MSKMILVNLPVRDIGASTAFYVALGGTVNPQFSGETSTSLMFTDAIGVMLLTHDHYREFTKRPIGDSRRDSWRCSPLRSTTAMLSMQRWRARWRLAAGLIPTRRRTSASCTTVMLKTLMVMWEIVWMNPSAARTQKTTRCARRRRSNAGASVLAPNRSDVAALNQRCAASRW